MRTATARVAIALVAAATACVHHIERTVAPDLTTVDHKAAFLKVHMKSGELYVLSEWRADELNRRVAGRGDLLGIDRAVVRSGRHDVAMADVALYETNAIVVSPSIAAMALITGASVALTVACATNPKACFGSCPTFYAPGEPGRGAVLQAEGFSDAISPALETHDIDALWRTRVTDGHLILRMTNEAYETHVVKRADVLAVPRPPGTRVLSTGDELWLASHLAPPIACTAEDGDCTGALAAVDERERTSLADPSDLAARETIDLAFPPSPADPGGGAGRAGVVIAARQTLVTTFLLYQGLTDLGTTAASWLAALERGGPGAARLDGRALQRAVGGIEVQVPDGDGWRTAGEVDETGPLATDVHLVLLPEGATGDRVRLRLPRGGWRIDHVARVAIEGRAVEQRIAPRAVRGTLGREFAGGRTPATALPIVTQPGDAYELEYDLPRGEVELFLDSRGYYLEWMRAEWMRADRPLETLKLLVAPAQALRDLAPAWKRMEAQSEQMFWSSRYAHP